jgi:hypothetical protein
LKRRREQLEHRTMPTFKEAATHVHTERSTTFKNGAVDPRERTGERWRVGHTEL